ncbi:excalibur calcium-binding domain-containing protein [Kineococcus sp. SYSU DK003]|uniref:excalibur calcium-binding domain-containing protein n=1 Tax=Kineococcus sp. SYSU DK003 TaxID=3383124 RepID=UPI003D7E175A
MSLLVLGGGSSVATAGTAAADDCVKGAIAGRYAQLGGAGGKLGAPTSCELPTSSGRFTTFEHGAVYWSPASGAWDVSGSFRDLWASTGWENGFLRYPTSGENPIAAGGVHQNYQGGTLYWSPSSGAHSVSGAFLQLYASTGYENGFLGYPLTQENPARGGMYQRFQGGVAYWSPSTGAHTVSGSFLELYGRLGFEDGCLGFPATQELPSAGGGVYQRFQGGVAYWSPATGAHALCNGPILDAYGTTGWEGGSLGYPTSEEHAIAGGRRVDFQRGFVEWSAGTGARVNGSIAAVPTTPAPGVHYANCDAARAAGAAPVHRGEPGYRAALDRDGDGIACES